MSKKKWIYISLIVILTGGVLFLYNAFNGNPLSKQFAKSTLKSHLASTYSDDEFRFDREFYSFKDGGYHIYVTRIGDADQTQYEFIMTGVFASHVYYDGIYWTNQDSALIEKLEKEASEELTALLQKSVPEIRDIDIMMQVLKDQHSLDTVWTKDFKSEEPMTIYIFIDAQKLSKEAILNAAETVQKTLNDNGYSYRSVGINAQILAEGFNKDEEPFWYLKYGCSFEKDTSLKLEQIVEYNN